MIVVSGCPRSGTSLMMQCLRRALGKDRVMGAKFPPQARRERALARAAHEHQRRTLEYVQQQMGDSERLQKAKDMNPKGFWECQYSVQGVQWHPGIEQNMGADTVCKIVSQGLARSNPAYIDRIIYMLRDPREVAKSQEDLQRGPLPRVAEVFTVHTPRMFVKVTESAAQWLSDYGADIPVLMMDFGALLEDPPGELERVREFLGEGDFSNPPVEQTLHRSKPEDVSHPLWPAADRMYNLMGKKRWADVHRTRQEYAPQLQREEKMIVCPRRESRSAYGECIKCRTIPRVSRNFRRQAEQDGIDWASEPCTFETGMGLQQDLPDGDYLSIDESARLSHWQTDGRGDDWWAENQRLLRKPQVLRRLEGEPADAVRDVLADQVQKNGMDPSVAAEIEAELLDQGTTTTT